MTQARACVMEGKGGEGEGEGGGSGLGSRDATSGRFYAREVFRPVVFFDDEENRVAVSAQNRFCHTRTHAYTRAPARTHIRVTLSDVNFSLPTFFLFRSIYTNRIAACTKIQLF